MARNHVQPGKVLDFVNTGISDIAAGSVVAAGALLGVALTDIPVGQSGSVAIDGVFEVPKALGVSLHQGSTLLWKRADDAFTAPDEALDAGDIAGAGAVAFAAAAADAATVHVKFTGVPGEVA